MTQFNLSFQKSFCALLFILIGTIVVAQQRDSTYIVKFDRTNVLEFNTGSYSTHFNFKGLRPGPDNFRLAANSNAYTGLYLKYKWLSVNYSWAIPGTELDKAVRLKQTTLSFRYNRPKMSFIPYYNYYNGLLIEKNKTTREFDAFRDMQLYDAGVQLLYFTNTGKYSYKAGTSFSEKQLKPAGGIIFSIIPQWQKINWISPNHSLINDSLTYELLVSDPQWVTLSIGAGYGYNFVLNKGKWIISPGAITGTGIVKELNSNNAMQPALNLRGWLNGGYSGPVFYAYLNAYATFTDTKLIIKKLDVLNKGLSVTAGYRFPSLKKKILGIL